MHQLKKVHEKYRVAAKKQGYLQATNIFQQESHLSQKQTTFYYYDILFISLFFGGVEEYDVLC